MSDTVPLTRWEGEPVAHWRERWAVPQLEVWPELGSSNDRLRELAAAGAPAGTTVIADFQAAGRGRMGRAWSAPPAQALLASVLLRPGAGGEAGAVLPLRVGLALADAIEALTGASAGLKWPNDVQLDGRKVAGILCESGAQGIIAGFGINVAQQAQDFPPGLRAEATSLRLATSSPPSRAVLAGAILARLAPLFSAPHRPLDADELARFAARDVLAGHDVSVDDAPAGRAVGITAAGALVVEQRGERRPVHAGTVRSTT